MNLIVLDFQTWTWYFETFKIFYFEENNFEFFWNLRLVAYIWTQNGLVLVLDLNIVEIIFASEGFWSDP